MEAGGSGGAPPRRSVYAEKFRIMLRLIPAPDGGEWSGTKMERATGGRVSTSYFSTLRDGHVETPRADKIEAVAEAMGFPPGLWFEDLRWWRELEETWERGGGVEAALGGASEGASGAGGRLARLLERLMETRVDPETGEPFTAERIAALSGGVLTVEDVEAILAGRLTDPTWAQVLALCDVFEVDPVYWSGRAVPSWRPSPALMEAARGAESYRIFQNSLKLSDKDRGMLKMLAEHLRREQREEEGS